MTFVVPPRFLRNHAAVLAMGEPADVALRLVEYMCRRLGVPNLAGLDVLDMGCGTRFTDMLMNREVAIGTYTGVDVVKEIIEFLQAEATDHRLAFAHFDAYAPIYNIGGRQMTVDTELPLGGRSFDVICMFSVITHQLPADAQALFAMLRRHVRQQGRLFFSCKIDDEPSRHYGEAEPGNPTGLSLYSTAHLQRLLVETGWRTLSFEPMRAEFPIIADSFLCAPADVENLA